MNREELEELTKVQLIEHAEVAGVKILQPDSKGTIIDKILGEYKAPEKVSDKPKANQELPPLGALYDLQGNRVDGRKFKLLIYSTESDKSDVDLIFNGHNIRIQRNKEVIVDEAFIGILNDAVIETIQQDPDTGKQTAQTVMVYPYKAIAC